MEVPSRNRHADMQRVSFFAARYITSLSIVIEARRMLTVSRLS